MSIISIKTQKEPLVSFGQSLFVVRNTEDKHFYTRCPICDDTKVVKINGHEFECPYCFGNTRFGKDGKDAPSLFQNEIRIKDYKVVEVIVNNVTITGSTVKSDYKTENLKQENLFSLPTARFSGFEKREGVAYSYSIPTVSFAFDPSIETMLEASRTEDYFFTSKKEAVKAQKELLKREEERLKAFNKKNNTTYAFPF